MTATAAPHANEVFRELVRTSEGVRSLNRDLDGALMDRDAAIVSAWRLGIGARTIAQVTDLTAARVAQIVERALAEELDARRQNRPLSRTLEDMNAIRAAHVLRGMIDPGNRYDVAIWTMAQQTARPWTPEQLATEMARYEWAPDPQLEDTLEELVDQRRQIHRIGDRLYELHAPEFGR